MSFLQKSFNEELTENVYEVILGILNPEDIEKGSVCEVLTSETYENNIPKTNGLFDLRMGTIEQGLNCETCFQDQRGCGGHFGHIKLVRPLYHMQFLPILLKISRVFCYSCSECLLDEDSKRILLTKPMKARFNIAYKKCKENQNPICEKCYTIQPIKYVNPKGTQDTKIIAKVYGEFIENVSGEKKKELKYFSCEQMLDFLKRIRNEDLDIIGIPSKTSRPDWMICTVFPVPPPHVRPSVRQENNQKSEDDLTHKLAEIINHNQTVKKEMENDNVQHIEDWTQLLQYHVATFVDNEIPGIPKAMQRSGRPIKSLKQRLQAKDGRMRYNLMGKRGDYTARTVITPDPNIELDEIGIPLKIARNLTIPVQVTENNIDSLKEYYNNGTDIYPGAKRLERGNKNYSLDGKKFKEQIGELKIKDILHRNLINGDYVLFNRQPSLHKMSMMGHRIRVLPVGNTFRMNVSATSPYNADFDGDEMNIFLTQCMEGFCELKFLASVPNQIISPQKNAPVIGLVQDTLYVCPQISLNNIRIPKDIWMNLSMFLENERTIDINVGNMTGRNIFNTILPKINLEKDTNLSEFTGDINDKLKIKDGVIERGAIDKKVVGSSHGGIIHVLWKDKGPNASKKFIYNCQKLCTQWLLNQGHSIGVSDVILIRNAGEKDYVIDEQVYSDIKHILDNAMFEVDYLLEKAGEGYYDTRSTLSVEDDIEKEILFVLNKARDNVGKIAIKHSLEHNPDNRLLKMVLSGSKGDKSGVYQIMATMGEAQVGSDRTPKKFYRRVLPHFTKDDNSALSRGFCKSSFKEGMKPLELYQLAIAARIGLIDKTVKTADTGYTQRRLIKSMEDLQVQYDGTVRSANNSILQFIYGDDGFDATFLENIGFKYHLMNSNLFEGNSNNLLEYYDICKKTLKNNDSIVSPFNLDRLFTEYKNNDIIFESNDIHNPTFDQIQLLRNDCINKIRNYWQEKLTHPEHTQIISNPFFILICYIEFYWRDSEINDKITKYSEMTYGHYLSYFNKIFDMFILSICASGEMVGILSGQSIGEPTTQMSLHQNEKCKILEFNKKEKTYTFKSILISEFCDYFIKQYPECTFNTGHYDSVETNIQNNDIEYYIMSVSENEKTHWNKISHISRHLVNGNLMTIKTKSGREVTTTLSHSHLIRKDNRVQAIRGDELKVGMRIPVSKKLKNYDESTINTIHINDNVYQLDYEFGILFGKYLSTNVLSDNNELNEYLINNCTNGYNTKKIPEFVFLANNIFKAGLLQGIILYNNIINDDIKYISDNKQLIKDMALLLNYFNIFANINQINETLYSLNIDSKYYSDYSDKIGLLLIDKQIELIDVSSNIDKINGLNETFRNCIMKLKLDCSKELWDEECFDREQLKVYYNLFNSHINNHLIQDELKVLEQALFSDVIWDEIVEYNIYTPDQSEYVYDFTIPVNQTFMTDYGIYVHNTLNTFHHTGIGGKSPTTSGVPRMKELLGVVKEPKTPVMYIYIQYRSVKDNSKVEFDSLEQKYKDNQYEHIRNFSYLFNELYVKDLCNNVAIDYLDGWKLTFEFEMKTLFYNNITSYKLLETIVKDANLINCEVKANINSQRQMFIITINVGDELLTNIPKFNGIYHKIKSIEYDILNILCNGVERVSNTYILTVNKEMYVQTSGSNLEDVLNNKWEYNIDENYKIVIDKHRCRSNNIHEMYNCFGIEVARNTLISEFTEVLESTGSINHRHITILVDNMTSKGMLIPIDRHGVKKNDIGPLSRATFEETVDQLMKAAAFGEEDTMRGVSANIMMGQMAPCGTGTMDVMLDEDKLFTFNLGRMSEQQTDEELIREEKIESCFNQLNTYKYPFDNLQKPIELPLVNQKLTKLNVFDE